VTNRSFKMYETKMFVLALVLVSGDTSSVTAAMRSPKVVSIFLLVLILIPPRLPRPLNWEPSHFIERVQQRSCQDQNGLNSLLITFNNENHARSNRSLKNAKERGIFIQFVRLYALADKPEGIT